MERIKHKGEVSTGKGSLEFSSKFGGKQHIMTAQAYKARRIQSSMQVLHSAHGEDESALND